MAWNEHAKKLAIKTLGTIESNMKYDGIYYVDAITIGIMQWYAGRARALLEKMRGASEYNNVAASLKKDIETHSSSDWSWWSRRYLTKAEGESLRPLLRSTIGVKAQNETTVSDFEDYAIEAKKGGLNPETNTNAFIFWCCMYHQGPRYAVRILNRLGANPTLENLYRAALNDGVFGKYKSRYDKAKSIILSGDVSGVPDTEQPGGETEHEGGDTGSGNDVGEGLIKYVRAVNDNLYIHTSKGVVTCYRTGDNYWTSGLGNTEANGGTGVPQPADPAPTPPAPGDSSVAAKIVAKYQSWLGRFSYSQGNGRLNPEQSGVGDCSSTIWRAYKDITGKDIGTWTGAMENKGTKIWEGKGVPPDSIMRPADIILYWWRSARGTSDHVELYHSTGKTLGHGGPGKGPKWGDHARLAGKAAKVRVIRHV